ncbi:MAG: hypothetical protein V4724_22220 [Pseudomonadota bacterium]
MNTCTKAVLAAAATGSVRPGAQGGAVHALAAMESILRHCLMELISEGEFFQVKHALK